MFFLTRSEKKKKKQTKRSSLDLRFLFFFSMVSSVEAFLGSLVFSLEADIVVFGRCFLLLLLAKKVAGGEEQ
jgi:hypothetical protein